MAVLFASTPANTTSRPACVARTFSDVKGKKPEESTAACTLSLTNAKFWGEAKAAAPAAHTPLDRPQASAPIMMSHFGQAWGQRHLAAEKSSVPKTDLKTHVEGVRRWREMANDERLSQLAPLDWREAVAAGDELGQKLWSSTRERLQCEYNTYPAAITLDEQGTIFSKPDHSATGMHAWFEPLARLDYTSRGSLSSLSSLTKAYADERTDLDADEKSSWMRDILQCRALLNLLYVSYFLPKAYPLAQDGVETDICREHLDSLLDVTGRLKQDYLVLRRRGDLEAPLEFRLLRE